MTLLDADLAHLLPHRPPMVLVDDVESWDADGCVARWTVPAGSPWVEDGRLRRAAFIEIAAQTAALHAGLAVRGSGHPARHGYLGMVTSFRCADDARAGDVLRSVIRRTTSFGVLSRIECRIERVADGASALLAGGSITVALATPPAA